MTDKKPQLPVVYSPRYDIGVSAMQRLHRFDLKKYSHVFNELVRRGLIERQQAVTPKPLTREELLSVHTPEYLKTWGSRKTLANIFEVPFVRKLPAFVTRWMAITPMLHQAGGSVKAAELSLKFGWAINIGGGFHHASSDHGHGFCPMADVSIAAKQLRLRHPEVKKIMIIDLDAHQGNGHERDAIGDKDTYILDIYNRRTFPFDLKAQARIDNNHGVDPGMRDEAYLATLDAALKRAQNEFKADAIIYIAGSDILAGDPLGQFRVSAQGIIKRDEMVFAYAFENKAPVTMLFGGGYLPEDAGIIADSIENLDRKFRLFNPPKP